MATQIDYTINNKTDFLKWMTTGKTTLCLKDPGKGNVIDNFWPISCLPIMWNLMTGIISNSVYEYLEMYKPLPLSIETEKR